MARTEAHAARNQAFRNNFSDLEVAISAVPPTAETVAAKASSLKLTHTAEPIPDESGGKVHFLGDKTHKKVILYLHGGGYALPPLPGHIEFLYQSLEQSGHAGSTLIAFLEYTLSGVAGFPTQMFQATEALRYLLSLGYASQNIIVAGDSAGGNLCLALMSNILHPYQGSSPLVLQESLAGVLMISPWVSCDTDTQSYKDYGETDIASPELLRAMGKAFLETGDRNAWSEPYLAGPSWWTNWPARTGLMVFGGAECFRDHIAKVAKDLDAAGANIKSVPCEDHVHVEAILDVQSGLEHGKMATEIWAWLKGAF